MALVRYQDWPARLAPLFAERMNEPFRWGRHDCALFACDAVLAMTGTDLAADFRGHYDSAIGAARRLRELGFRTLNDVATAFASRHGIAQVDSPRFAQRGDVGLVTPPPHPLPELRSAATDRGVEGEIKFVGALGALLICSGDGFVAARETGGLVKVPARLVSAAWRI